MEQDPNQPIGKCREICGDGILLPTTVHQCDDSNINDFDGCSSSCMVEEGWIVISKYIKKMIIFYLNFNFFYSARIVLQQNKVYVMIEDL